MDLTGNGRFWAANGDHITEKFTRLGIIKTLPIDKVPRVAENRSAVTQEGAFPSCDTVMNDRAMIGGLPWGMDR